MRRHTAAGQLRVRRRRRRLPSDPPRDVDPPFHPAPGRGRPPTVRLHDLRHFVATTLLASGTDLATVAGRLGHGSGGKTTLAIYGHFLRGAPPDRAAADLLAGLVRPGEPSNGGR